jgi:hypothetical protein
MNAATSGSLGPLLVDLNDRFRRYLAVRTYGSEGLESTLLSRSPVVPARSLQGHHAKSVELMRRVCFGSI